MNPLKALREFFSSSVDGAAPMDDPFVEIDRDVVAERLGLARRGAELGAQNTPPADAIALDVVETEVISSIKDHLNRAQIEASNHVRTYEQRLSELHLLHELAAIKSATEKALGDFKAEVLTWNNRLANRRDAIADSYSELRSFKRDNDLSRPFHEVPTLVVPVGAIAFAWLAEALGNSIFLRVNDEMGLLGGVIAAMVIAAVNVAISVFVGKTVYPRTNLKGADRAVAYGAIGVWLVFLFAWNVIAAHYRDAKSAGTPDPESAALAMAIDAPLGLDSIYSWGLFVIGLLAAIVSARAGYRMDDPYPGYGDIGRRHKERCEDYASEVDEATTSLRSIRDEALEEAHSVKRELGQQFRERRRIIAAHSAFRRRYSEHQDHLEQIANMLLSFYRHANKSVRTTPPPVHYDERWTFQRSYLTDLNEESVREADVEAADAALDKAIDLISAAFDSSIQSFKPLDELKQELARAEV